MMRRIAPLVVLLLVVFLCGCAVVDLLRVMKSESDNAKPPKSADKQSRERQERAIDTPSTHTWLTAQRGLVAVDVVGDYDAAKIENTADGTQLVGPKKSGVFVVADAPPGRYRLRGIASHEWKGTQRWTSIPDTLAWATFDVVVGVPIYVGRIKLPKTLEAMTVEPSLERELEVWKKLVKAMPDNPWVSKIQKRIAELKGVEP